jgi:hypothetical protein
MISAKRNTVGGQNNGPVEQPRPAPGLDLRVLVIRVFQAIGALVEEGDRGLIDVLIPDSYRARFDGASFLRLGTDPTMVAAAGGQLLSIGSPLVDGIVAVADEFGKTGRWFVDGLRWSRRQAINLERWPVTFTNARFLTDGIERAFASHYLLLNVRVSYLSDEKRDELHTIALDTVTRQPSPLLGRFWEESLRSVDGNVYVSDSLRPARAVWPEPVALLRKPSVHLAGSEDLPDRTALDTLRHHAVLVLERQIGASIDTYRHRAAHQLELERRRIEAFFGDTDEELARRLHRADADERRQSIESKISANRLERDRKLADVAAKLRLRVIFHLLNAAFITQPKIQTMLKVENRYASAALAVVFDPLNGELELPSCQHCFLPTSSVHLCANGHVVCDNCARPCSFCGREYCIECGIGTCDVCEKPVCVKSQVRCDVCGKTTCQEHRGQCHAQ